MEKNRKILIADQSDSFGRSCAQLLRSHGLAVETTVKDGRILLDMMLKQQPELVVMDMFLPNLDALGVMKGMRSRQGSPSPHFIVLFGFDSPELEREVMEAGADYFFLKPFNMNDLVDRILSLCQPELPAESFRRIPTVETSAHSASLEMRVTEILHQIGVPAHIKGYQYLRDAILLSIEDDSIINAVTKRLYPSVAKKHATTSSRVERAIRHAIEVAWDRGDVDVLNSYFGYTIHNGRGKPTNSEFIAMISDRFRLQLKIS